MKIDLYIDFDGVILNTIDVTYSMYDRVKDEYSDMKDFYKSLDWKMIFELCLPINDSINNINRLVDSNLYNVYILSHVVTDSEEQEKRKFISRNFDDVKLIAVPRDVDKCDVVDCFNAVLVDDYMGNLVKWESRGGIAIKFSDKGKKYNIMSISNLGMLIDKYNDIKKLIK